MNMYRRLAEGVASWLKFEFSCSRGHLFEEKYLSFPIGQILSSEYGKQVHAEYEHPVLTQHMVGPGKRPKIDFVILKNKTITFAVESKWTGKTPVKVEDLIWDIIRLELVANHCQAEAVFLLAGLQWQLRDLFENKNFLAKNPNRRHRPILKDGKNSSMALRLDTPPKQRVEIIKNLVQRYPLVHMPCRISSGNPYIYPKDCSGNDFQVMVWNIRPSRPRESFLARDHRLYNT